MKCKTLFTVVAVLGMTISLLLGLSACTSEATATSIPTWIVDNWRLQESEIKGVYISTLSAEYEVTPQEAEPNQMDRTFVFVYTEYEGIPVLRLMMRQQFYHNRDISQLNPTPTLTQEYVIRSTLEHIIDRFSESVSVIDHIAIFIHLDDSGWNVAVHLREENGIIWVIHRSTFDQNLNVTAIDFSNIIEWQEYERAAMSRHSFEHASECVFKKMFDLMNE